MLVVQKYGGTSVATPERIANVAKRVIEYKKRGDGLVIVVSAMSGETDRLLGLAQAIAKFPDDREVDVLISTGEQVTSALLAITLKEMGHDAVSVLGHQVPIVTDSAFGKAQDLRHRRDQDPHGTRGRQSRCRPRFSGCG